MANRRDIFTKPEAPKIIRETERDIGRVTTVKQEKVPPRVEEKKPTPEKPTVELAAETTDPVFDFVTRTYDRLLARADVVEAEALILGNQIVRNINRDLSNAPAPIIEAINELTDSTGTAGEYANSDLAKTLPSARTELSEDHLRCIAKASGYLGETEDADGTALLKKVVDDANNLNGFDKTVNEMIDKASPKITGLWLFWFLVRFIVAYAVHATVGFMCCYMRDKLEFKIGPFGPIRFGLKISKILGPLESLLKGMLGFPCAGPNPQDRKCLEPGQMQAVTEESLNLLPCCNPESWDSCGGLGQTARQPLVNLSRCLKNMGRGVSDLSTGDGNGLPCCNGSDVQNPSMKNREVAKGVMDWLLMNSQESTKAKNNPYNKDGVSNYNILPTVGSAVTTARQTRTITEESKGVFVEGYKYDVTYGLNQKDRKCSIISIENKLGALGSYGDMTEDDVKRVMKEYVDTDFTDELSRANADISTVDIDLNQPNIEETLGEPYRSIVKGIKFIDDGLTSILEELRKAVVVAEQVNGLLVSKEFCCIIYGIVVVANLVRYGKLCPEKDFAEIFQYAQDFGDNKDVQDLLDFLKFLKEMIDALNDELASEISFTGVGLPLGSMLEVMKKGIASIVSAVLALAFAPIDKALTELENQPRLKGLLTNNCFGLGDILAMIKCGLKWITDLIKKWTLELLPFKLRNEELLASMRIGSYQLAFLKMLSDLLDRLIELLTNIGDCYPPENVAKQILDDLPEKPYISREEPRPPTSIVYNPETIRDELSEATIGSEVVMPNGDVVFKSAHEEVLNEFIRQANNPGSVVSIDAFPIGTEATKTAFIDIIRQRKGLDLKPLEEVDGVEVQTGTEMDTTLKNFVRESKPRSTARPEDVFDMVAALKQMDR